MLADLHLNLVNFPAKETGKDGHYYDFIISGKSLREYLGLKDYQSATPLNSWFIKMYMIQSLKEFRLQNKTELPGNRLHLYVCADCGEIDCGAVTVEIIDKGDRIVWTKFANQSDKDEIGELFDVEDLEFDRENYFKAFSSIR